MPKSLHQITMTFNAEEDRMLLRISTTDESEYQLWLTRRFIKVLWAALISSMERHPDLKKSLQPKIKDAMLNMRHQEALSTSNFKQPHVEGKRNLTSNTGPLMVTGGTVTPLKNGATKLTFNTSGGQGINFSLDEKLLHAVCHLIITSAQKADWNLDLTVGDPTVITADKSLMH